MTDVGRVRKGNEDSYRLDEHAGIFLVADGMGGHAAGEVASRLAAEQTLGVLTSGGDADAEALLRSAFESSHRAIVECCQDDPATAGMGTTLTVAVAGPDREIVVGHIGDSRLYHLSGGTMRQVTVDHTWVQREIDAGRVSPDAAGSHPLSHILTRVLSDDEPSTPDIIRFQIAAGDKLMLCTDGLHNMLDDEDLQDFLELDMDPEAIADCMLDGANDEGGLDNITCIVVAFDDAD